MSMNPQPARPQVSRQDIEEEFLRQWKYHRENPMGSYAAHGAREMELVRARRQALCERDELEASGSDARPHRPDTAGADVQN